MLFWSNEACKFTCALLCRKLIKHWKRERSSRVICVWFTVSFDLVFLELRSVTVLHEIIYFPFRANIRKVLEWMPRTCGNWASYSHHQLQCYDSSSYTHDIWFNGIFYQNANCKSNRPFSGTHWPWRPADSLASYSLKPRALQTPHLHWRAVLVFSTLPVRVYRNLLHILNPGRCVGPLRPPPAGRISGTTKLLSRSFSFYSVKSINFQPFSAFFFSKMSIYSTFTLNFSKKRITCKVAMAEEYVCQKVKSKFSEVTECWQIPTTSKTAFLTFFSNITMIFLQFYLK